MKKTVRKIFLYLTVLLNIFSLSIPSFCSADVFDVGNPTEIAEEAMDVVESRLGIDESAMQGMMSNLNYAQYKVQTPQVSITFNPSNPVPGQKVTANAQAMYFTTAPEKMYFTWLLAHKGDPTEKASHDDLEDYKIEAARIIASNGFDWENTDYSKKTSGDNSYRAHYGGDDQVNKIPYCFYFNASTGRFYPDDSSNPLTSGCLASNTDSCSSCSLINNTCESCQAGDTLIATEACGTTANHGCTAGTHGIGTCVDCNLSELNCEACQAGDSYHKPCGSGDTSVYGCTASSHGAGTGVQCTFCNLSTNQNGFSCGHLFPKPSKTGNGSFSNEDAAFWHTNPDSKDTGGYGQPDEATIAGLGMKSFSWIYQDGDRVGLGVEGTSMIPTKTDDASYKILWAFSGEGCDPSDSIDSFDDMNDKCLPRSFVNPMDEGTNEKLDISLDYAPQYPANNPDDLTGENSDILSISANVSGSKDNRLLYYNWKVYSGNSADSEGGDWKILTKNQLLGSEQLSGTGVDNIKFGLNFKDSPKYLKIKLLVSESAASGKNNTSRGQATVIIPLMSNSERLNVYAAKVSEDSSLSKGDLRCSNPNKICQVAKNEIMAIEAADSLNNFLWTINGQTLSYNYIKDFTEPENLVYFPITKSVGSEFTLTMTATNKETGEKVVLTKNFKVVDPDILIFSSDETTCAPTILGYFLNPDGTETPDESQKNFEALQGSTISLEALFLGPANDLASLEWSVPEANLSSLGKNLSFEALNPIGSSYTVNAAIAYAQDTATKKALYDYWNVPFGQFYEKEITKQINIDVVDSLNAEEGELVQNGKKPVASLFSGISAYFIFLFKLMLTTALIIFGLGILSSLASTQREEK